MSLAYSWFNMVKLIKLNRAETVLTMFFMSCPSGEGAGTGKSVGERASAFGRAEEAALRVGWSPSRPGFSGER